MDWKAKDQLKVSHFHLNWVSHNLSLLIKLQQGELLEVNSEGKLKRLQSAKEKRLFSLKNRLFLRRPERNTLKAIEWTLMGFCHEVRNPLNAAQLRVMKNKVISNAERAIANLSSQNYEKTFISRLKEYVRQYAMAAILQEKILKSIAKGVRRSAKSSKLLRNGNILKDLSQQPIIPKRGISGTYVIHGSQTFIAGVFKPCDEELGGPNNPIKIHLRGAFGHSSEHYHLRIGEGVHREVGAYVVDRFLRLGIVPETCYMECSHPSFFDATQGKYLEENKKKQGSFQEYIIGYKHLSELRRWEIEQIPVDQFHRLILLDLIIGNLDRHISNVLTNGKKMVAIDHGLSFPSRHMNGRVQSWVRWPQMRMAFFPSLYETIETLPIELLCAKLRKQCFIDEISLARMRERVSLLQTSLKMGLNPLQTLLLMSASNLDILKDLSATLPQEAEKIVNASLEKHAEMKAKKSDVLCLA